MAGRYTCRVVVDVSKLKEMNFGRRLLVWALRPLAADRNLKSKIDCRPARLCNRGCPFHSAGTTIFGHFSGGPPSASAQPLRTGTMPYYLDMEARTCPSFQGHFTDDMEVPVTLFAVCLCFESLYTG